MCVSDIDVRVLDNRDALAGSVNAHIPEWRYIVDRREIVGTDDVAVRVLCVTRVLSGDRKSELGLRNGDFPRRFLSGDDPEEPAHRLSAKVVQRIDAADCRRQRRRNLRIAGIGPVLLAVDHVLVNCGMQRLLHLAGGAGELHHSAALGRAHLKSMRLQPRSDGLNVSVAGAELLAEVPGCQPFVIVGRTPVLLVVEKLFQRRFLLRTTLQYQKHALHGQRGRGAAQIKLGTR